MVVVLVVCGYDCRCGVVSDRGKRRECNVVWGW